jgi:hypothetical protein
MADDSDDTLSVSALRIWLCNKIDSVFGAYGSTMSYKDARYVEWTGLGQSFWEKTWANEKARIDNGEDPNVVGVTASCKDLLIAIVNMLRTNGTGDSSYANSFASLVFNLPAAGAASGAWHYIGEAGNSDGSMPDGILMPRPGDFFQGELPGGQRKMHVGVISDFDRSQWTALEGGQGARWTDCIKRIGPRPVDKLTLLGWLDIDPLFPDYEPRAAQ